MFDNENCSLVGTSSFCEEVKRQIPILASSDIPVLIVGDTGTGKDVIARMIHHASKRSAKPYLCMNCATLGSLAESELFGHVTGAFTGAVRGTKGYIGSANGGTLLLDEVGELSLEVQAKLLRFLDNGEYFRVGSSTPQKADIRIIAATNRDLKELCEAGRFREDLYYRLAGMTIRTVPLNERPEDIPLLVKHFADMYSRRYGENVSFSPEAVELLTGMEWPGNVRQLKHAVFKICHFSQQNLITSEDIERIIGQPPNTPTTKRSIERLLPYKEAKRKALEEFDREYFSKLLKKTRGQVKEALAISKMHKKNFYTKLKELGIKPSTFRDH